MAAESSGSEVNLYNNHKLDQYLYVIKMSCQCRHGVGSRQVAVDVQGPELQCLFRVKEDLS